MSHANAVLTPRTKLRLARLIIDNGYSVAVAAKMFMVSPVTARKWAARYRTEGAPGMQDRSSRPHRVPHKTPEATKKRIVALRWRLRLGPAQIAGRLRLSPSTVHAVLARCGVNRLSHIDLVTGEPLRRYDATTLRAPLPGIFDPRRRDEVRQRPRRRRAPLRRQTAGHANRRTSENITRGKNYRALIGTAFVYTVIDDNSRVAYGEICSDEEAVTAIGVLERAIAWFAEHGVTVERMLSDNGSAYKSFAWRDACARLGIAHKRTRPPGVAAKNPFDALSCTCSTNER